MQDVRHTWDAGGNLTQRQNVVDSETESFTYDYLDRLTSASGPYTESFTYNEIGNITSKNGTSYTYGTKPHAVTQVGTTNYTYDDNGNMNVGTARTWDVENRLTSITKDTVTTTFAYDGDGNRIKKTVGGTTTIYINQYYEKTGTEVTTNYYLGGKLIAVKKGADLSYVLQDHLGSTSATANASGTVTSTIKYFSFGSTRSSTGTLPTDKKFTGQRLDTTGLYYYGARYYDPQIGRFISADTIVPHPGNPQSLNRYSYCLNNPLKYIDPSGHDPGDGLDAPTENGQLGWTSKDGWLISHGGQWQQTNNRVVNAIVSTNALGITAGIGASWFTLTHWPGIGVENGVIYDKDVSGSSRYFQIDVHRLNGINDVTHFNADIGPLADFNHTKLPSIAQYTKPAAKGIVVAGVVLDALDVSYSIHEDYQSTGQLNFGPNTQDAVGRVTGGWGGALAGAAIGTAICPVVGTIIGGIAGGIGGGLLGGQIPGWLR